MGKFEMLQLFMISAATFISWPVNGYNEITLTTATIRASTSAKPTTLNRRINNDSGYNINKNVELYTRRSWKCIRSFVHIVVGILIIPSVYLITSIWSTIYNIAIYSHVHLILTRTSKLWDWDIWCQLQPKRGNCTEKLKKYYYEADSDQCLMFEYSGCKGNKNNFDAKEQCEGRCKGATLMILRDSAPITYCSLQVNAGYCMGLIKRYYYDINQGTCRRFTYGGCGGNQNNFETMRKCLRECQSDSEEDFSY